MILGAIALAVFPLIPTCEPPGHRSAPVVAPAPPGPTRGAFALRTIVDVPLPGAPVRFDYTSLDTAADRLYVAHMDAGTLLVFDVKNRQVVANLDGFTSVHGVLAVPELNRVYASATGRQQVVVVDTRGLTVLARVGGIEYPDGIAYAPNVRRVFVSDEHGRADAVLDVFADTLVKRIPLGGEAGNTIYDPVTACILVAVHDSNAIAVIDPETNKIVARVPVPGIVSPHGVALDAARRVAFVAGQKNARLALLDLDNGRVIATYAIGADPDVLAVDPDWGRVYVASESGTVSAFTEIMARDGLHLVHEGDFLLPSGHSVAVDPRTHLLYFPLQDIGGQPVMRIMTASPPAGR